MSSSRTTRDGVTQAAWQARHELFESSLVALMLATPVIAVARLPTTGRSRLSVAEGFLRAAAQLVRTATGQSGVNASGPEGRRTDTCADK